MGWLQAALRDYDQPLVIVVGTLLMLGLIMVYSSSFSYAYALFEQSAYFFTRQLMWAGIGLMTLVFFMWVDYHLWQRLAVAILFGMLGLLILPLIVNAANFGAAQSLLRSGSVQPSEAAKLGLVIYNAAWLASKGERLRELGTGLIPYAIILAGVDGLVIMEPDFGTAILLFIIAAAMFFIAGAEIKQLAIGSLLSVSALAFFISRSAHAMQRVRDFIATVKDPLHGGSYHVQQLIRALAEGGFLGRGIGQSQIKGPGGVPLPWSDSIFAILGNELGLLGSLFVLGLFLMLAYRGLRITLNAPDKDHFGGLLAFGITCWLVSQAFINIAVITATAPLTGMTLPFISFGGSSLVTSLAGVGILLNISRAGNRKDADDAPAGLWRWNRGTRLSGSGRDPEPTPSADWRAIPPRRSR
jgi:cell division protein FtsW